MDAPPTFSFYCVTWLMSRDRERSNVERVLGRLKDEFGARNLRVRGHQKVTCHLMFGMLALTLGQLMRLAL